MAEEENNTNNNGTLSRHPLRTAGVALMAGTAIGAGLVKAKKDRRSSLQKLREVVNDAL